MVMDANTPIPSGGASYAIDATNPKDQAMIRQAIKNTPRRWRGLSEDFKATVVEDLKWARTQAREVLAETDLTGAIDRVLSVAKTAAMIEGQNQKDEHAVLGLNRNETTVNVAVGVGVELPRDRELRAQLIEVHARLEEADARSKMQRATEGTTTNGNGHA